MTLSDRLAVLNDLKNIITNDGSSYFNRDYLIKHIIGGKNEYRMAVINKIYGSK